MPVVVKVHADTAMVNLNVWLAPDSANLGSAKTDDGGGLTVFHAKPPGLDTFAAMNKRNIAENPRGSKQANFQSRVAKNFV